MTVSTADFLVGSWKRNILKKIDELSLKQEDKAFITQITMLTQPEIRQRAVTEDLYSLGNELPPFVEKYITSIERLKEESPGLYDKNPKLTLKNLYDIGLRNGKNLDADFMGSMEKAAAEVGEISPELIKEIGKGGVLIMASPIAVFDRNHKVQDSFGLMGNGEYYNSLVSQQSSFEKLGLAEDVKYQIGLAAANSLIDENYRGHKSPVSSTTDVTVIVAKSLLGMKSALGHLQTANGIEFPQGINETNFDKNIITLGGADVNDLKQRVVIVSEQYLRENLGAEIQFMKGYEAMAEKCTITTNQGQYKLADFLREQASPDAEGNPPALKVNSSVEVEKLNLAGVKLASSNTQTQIGAEVANSLAIKPIIER